MLFSSTPKPESIHFNELPSSSLSHHKPAWKAIKVMRRQAFYTSCLHQFHPSTNKRMRFLFFPLFLADFVSVFDPSIHHPPVRQKNKTFSNVPPTPLLLPLHPTAKGKRLQAEKANRHASRLVGFVSEYSWRLCLRSCMRLRKASQHADRVPGAEWRKRRKVSWTPFCRFMAFWTRL